MFYKLSEEEISVVKRIEEKTNTDYELEDGTILIENLLIALKNILEKNEILEKRLDEIIEDRNENYQLAEEKDPYYEYGISERDFH